MPSASSQPTPLQVAEQVSYDGVLGAPDAAPLRAPGLFPQLVAHDRIVALVLPKHVRVQKRVGQQALQVPFRFSHMSCT